MLMFSLSQIGVTIAAFVLLVVVMPFAVMIALRNNALFENSRCAFDWC